MMASSENRMMASNRCASVSEPATSSPTGVANRNATAFDGSMTVMVNPKKCASARP